MLCAGNMADEFYLRYYTGHQGKFGHEFLEFEFRLLVRRFSLKYCFTTSYGRSTPHEHSFGILKMVADNMPGYAQRQRENLQILSMKATKYI